MSQQRTLYITMPHDKLSEQPSHPTKLGNDPTGSAEPDRVGDHVSPMAGQDTLVMYVGCPSRLKLLGLHLGAASVIPSYATEERYPMMAHADDLSL